MKVSIQERKTRANEIHKNKYDYSLWPDNVKSRDKVNIICPMHGLFVQSVQHHINRAQGCPKCSMHTREQTLLDKYGVLNVSQLEEIKEKKKLTTMANFGVENPLQSDIVRKKVKTTVKKKYGVLNVSQLEEIKEKKKLTTMANFGVQYPQQSAVVRLKRENNNFKKYERLYPIQLHLTEETLQRVQDIEWLKEQHHTQQKPIKQIADELNFDHSTLCVYFRKYGIEIKRFYQSIGEKEVAEYVENFGLDVQIRSREIIPPFEIDIFIPEYMIGIEYNGEYWHDGSKFPDVQERDKMKKKRCQEIGIELVTIREEDWVNNNNQVKQYIKEVFYGE